MAYNYNVTGLNLASGVVLAIVGVSLLALRPPRKGSRAFAAFVALWGAQIVVLNVNVFAMRDGVAAFPWGALGLALLLPQPVVLLLAASRFPAGAGSWLPLPFAALGLGASVAFLARPALFVDPAALATPLGVATISVPVVIVLPLATLAFARRRIEAQGETLRRELTLLLFALLPYGAFTTARLLQVQNLSSVFEGYAPSIQAMYAAAFAVSALLLAATMWMLARHASDASARWLLAATVAAAGIAVAQRLAGTVDDPLAGLTRILAAGLFAYALLKHHVFDIDLRVKWALVRGAVAAVIATVFFVVSEGIERVLAIDGFLYGVSAAGIVVLLLRPIERLARRFADTVLPHVSDTPAYERTRREELYRAALEGAVADGEVTAKERTILRRLQLQLDIPEGQAVEMEEDVRRQHGMAA